MASDSQLREWAHCHRRAPYLVTALMRDIASSRRKAADARNAFNRAFMGEPSQFLADGYDACADIMQAQLDRLVEAGKEPQR